MSNNWCTTLNQMALSFINPFLEWLPHQKDILLKRALVKKNISDTDPNSNWFNP